MAREHTLVLVKGLTFVAGEDVLIDADTVELDELRNSTCPKAAVIRQYFGDDLGSGAFLSFLESFVDDQFCINMRKDLAPLLCQHLQDPFVQIRIERMDANEDTELLVLEKRVILRDVLTAEPIDDSGCYGEIIPIENEFPSEDLRLSCNVSIGWIDPPKAIKICAQSFMGKLLEEESTMDLTIVAGNGVEVKCHKLIFAAHAPAFSTMVSPRTGMKEARSKRVEMGENSEEGIRQLLKYMYGMDLIIGEMSSDIALELFQTAHKYGLSQLEVSLLEQFLERDMVWFTPDIILEMYFYVKDLDALEKLREHALSLMASMPTRELRACEEFMKLSKAESVDLSLKLVEYLQEKVVPKSKPKPGKARKGVKKTRRRSSSSVMISD